MGGVAAQEERTIDRPMTVEKFSMGGRGVILCDIAHATLEMFPPAGRPD